MKENTKTKRSEINEMEESAQVLYQKLGDRWYAITDTKHGICYAIMPEGVDPRKHPIELIQEVESNKVLTESKKEKKKEIGRIYRKPAEGPIL
ncbi:MAG: hypothetical protein HQK50_02420 [Oligoflexia bacterium]|nr:hypothetical protein [Oligoflexia bacterium]